MDQGSSPGGGQNSLCPDEWANLCERIEGLEKAKTRERIRVKLKRDPHATTAAARAGLLAWPACAAMGRLPYSVLVFRIY